ncbi:MAG: hypothetical protein NTU61_00285, partial [Candidatus Altiarchaeota archaeon]|nr:hypothetical protein [Candidatus Altiarchaeota archaeon]
KIRNMIEGRRKRRDEFAHEAMLRTEELGRKLSNKEISKHEYDGEAQKIKAKIESMNEEMGPLEALHQGETQEKKPEEKVNEEAGPVNFWIYAAAGFVLVAILVFIYLNSSCVNVSFSTKAPRILSLLQLVGDKSPGDHEMICRYVDGIDYRQSYSSGGYARIPAEGQKMDRTIILSSVMMDYYNDDDSMVAGVLVHEACHYMMNTIMGGFDGMKEEDVERPCERMRYMFLYRAGRYGSYKEMVGALSNEAYGKTVLYRSSGIPSALKQYREDRIYRFTGNVEDYCKETKLEVKGTEQVDGYSLQLTNTGGTVINCGFVELTVNGREYPLDCFDLAPGQSHATGPDLKIERGESYNVRVAGCPDAVATPA